MPYSLLCLTATSNPHLGSAETKLQMNKFGQKSQSAQMYSSKHNTEKCLRHLRKVEFEVELPSVDSRRIFSLLVRECKAQLDNF